MEGTIKLQHNGGYYETTAYRLDKAMREFAGVSIDRLTEILAEHTGCDYSDVRDMSTLLIIAAETHLV
jgi:hypothetical protein